MLEKFDTHQQQLISSYAQTVWQFEHGTVHQRNLNEFFQEDPEYYLDDLQIMEFWCCAEPLGISGYAQLKECIYSVFPDMEEAYLPFAIGDLLKEADEASQKGVENNGN